MKKVLYSVATAFVGCFLYDMAALAFEKLCQRNEWLGYKRDDIPDRKNQPPKEPIGFKQESAKC